MPKETGEKLIVQNKKPGMTMPSKTSTRQGWP